MSRKDYRAFADVLAGDLSTCNNEGERRKVIGIVLSMCDVFKRDNGAFDRQRFLLACGIDPSNPMTSATMCADTIRDGDR